MILNRRRILYALLSLILAGLTIAACLIIEHYTKYALDPKIVFNYESGFYDEPIQVEMSTGSSYFITYTLDGRAPNAASKRYDGPILINDASENENVWSMIKETSLYYYEPANYVPEHNVNVPDYKIDKCTVLRAAAFDYSGNQVGSDVREYFIDFGKKSGYKSMYNLCVVTNPENFFDVEGGIYHAGAYWEGKIESCEIYDKMAGGSEYWDEIHHKTNWDWSGRYAERAATIEVFNPQGKLLMKDDCGVRISGNASRNEPQKSLRFFAREEYSGKNRFSYDLFNDGEAPSTFLIHNFGDDFQVKMIDYVVYSALRNNDYKYTQTIPCNLFIDGEYWGPMFLEKPVSCETIAEFYGVAEDNVVLIKSDEVKMDENFWEMTESELSDWRDLQDFIRNNDMSNLDNYEYVCSKMDVEDFAQYAAIEIYIGNAGWHINNNSACWRTLKKEKGNEYADGRWRFSLFDVNWSFEPDSEVYAQIDKEWDFYQMVKRLCKNEDFKKLYLGEINNMEQTFETSTVSLIIDEWSNVMEEPIRCHFKRFGIQNDADEVIEKEKKKIISYCINRPDEIDGFNEKLFE